MARTAPDHRLGARLRSCRSSAASVLPAAAPLGVPPSCCRHARPTVNPARPTRKEAAIICLRRAFVLDPTTPEQNVLGPAQRAARAKYNVCGVWFSFAACDDAGPPSGPPATPGSEGGGVRVSKVADGVPRRLHHCLPHRRRMVRVTIYQKVLHGSFSSAAKGIVAMALLMNVPF
jgi:hypothetical protein